MAALLAVGLGSKLFGKKVASLEDAVKASENVIDRHLKKLEIAVDTIKNSIVELNDSSAAVGEKLSKIEGREIEESDESKAESGNAVNNSESKVLVKEKQISKDYDPVGLEEQQNVVVAFRNAWDSIRIIFERIANSPKLDGRTRAAYLRVDRRSYEDLVDKLSAGKERHLSNRDIAMQAVRLRNRFKRGKMNPTAEDVSKMESYLNDLRRENYAQE